jgi:hypothetical protein
MGKGGRKEKENLFWQFDYRAWERNLGKDCINFFVRCNPFVLSIEDVQDVSLYLDVYVIVIFPCGELMFSCVMIHY